MKSINKRFIFSFLLACLFFTSPVFAVEEVTGESAPGDMAIIILSTNTVREMQTARKIIEKNGGKIRSVFPPRVFIVTIRRNISVHLEGMDIIKEISYEKINPDYYTGYESSVQDAIKLWNRKLDKILKPEEEEVLKPEKEEPFRDDVIIPTDLPETREEKIKKDREYQERWKLEKEKLQGVDATGAPAAGVSAEFGEAYGAGYYDTSLYMAGDIAVGVFFREGADGAWTPENIDSVFVTICDALDQFIDDEPNADISFTCIKEVDESGIPNPAPSSYRDYVNDLRNIYNTHWAFMITVTNESGRAYAYLFGPITQMYSSNGYISNRTVRHETMHIFGAMDQYCPDACRSPIDRWGYLNVVNANSRGNDGKGYFSGAGEGFANIMTGSNGPIGVYSRGQIGWRDSDGDGILEPLDTFPDTVILTKTGANPFTYTGRASDKPLLNDYKSTRYGDVTLNTITRIEYRINGGAWSDTEPSDGAFDNGEEEFTFDLPSLSDGSYTIEVRAINSVGNTEVSYAKDEILIDGSPITNVRPFASFSITPKKGSVETNFIFDASVSSDIEDAGSVLQVRWDFEDDGVWDTDFSENKIASYNYSTAGAKTIRLEVMDSSGLTHTAARQIDVAAANIAPEAFFTATPENQHGDYLTFDVELNAAGSYDGEDAATELLVRWDFENDGVWDTDYSNTMAITHSYELSTGLPGIVLDTPGYARGVYASGNYAYVTDGNSGLQVIDITDPINPFIVASSDTPGWADSVYVSGNYAYVGDGYEGLQVIDIIDPAAPYIVGSIDTPGYAHGVSVSGNYAYVADGTTDLHVIDISDPANPYIAGSIDTPSGYARGVYVSGNYAYVVDSPWLKVIDITDPTAPYIVGSLRTDGGYGVYVSGNYAYVAAAKSGLQVIDITDPANPYIAGSIDTPEDAFNVYVSGDYAYVATTGLEVIDITDPTAPYIVASRDTPSEAWGVYVLGNYAYVPDILSGLWIIDITYPFKFEVIDKSTHWRAKLEVMDTDGNISGATRDVWAVTYNEPPSVSDIEFFPEGIALNLTGSCNIPYYATGVYVSGNYAYVANETLGLQVIDITDPANPFIVGSSDTPDYAWRVYVSGDYAYVADYSSGLQVIDITDPAAPYIVGNIDTPGRAMGVYVSGNYAYVADGNSGLQVIDITDPANPFIVGSSGTGWANGVYVSGDYAYVINGSSGLQVIDITDPANPFIVGSSGTGGYGVYVSGNYAYVAAAKSGGDGLLEVIDISDPTAPYIVGSSDTSGTARSVSVSGNYAYVADGYGGLQVIDITDPTAPYIVGSRNTSDYAWGVYVSGGYIYTASRDLQIFQAEPGSTVRALGGTDPDIDTTWDGLLEYRWDIDNDGVWDTEFSESDSYTFAPPSDEYAAMCEVKDRFNATDRVVITIVVGPNISVSPVFKDFGSVAVGSSSDSTFTVSNDGTENLIIGTITPPDSPFSIITDNCSNQTLAPLASCDVVVRFDPTGAIAYAGNFNIPSNDPDTPDLTVSLTGTGIQPNPDISVSPASYDFGNVRKETTSPPVTFTISNTGGADLVIGGVYLTGLNPYQFRIRNDNCSGRTLASSGSCTIEAVYRPTKRGTMYAKIGIGSNDPDTPTLYIELTGTGVEEHEDHEDHEDH